MATSAITFSYFTGVWGEVFPKHRAFLVGSWDTHGRYASSWKRSPMRRLTADDGGTAFRATVRLDQSESGKNFQWGVVLVSPDKKETWAIATEVNDPGGKLARHCEFNFTGQAQSEAYFLTQCRRLGASKRLRAGKAGVRFAVWAPNARKVDVVFATVWDAEDPACKPTRSSLPIGQVCGGYIAPDGAGIDPATPPVPLVRKPDGVWESDPADPALSSFSTFLHRPYMYRVQLEDGSIAYRTDLYSRCQIGYGSFDPANSVAPELPYKGTISRLDGTVSCSTVVDPEIVTRDFDEQDQCWPEKNTVSADAFWSDEFADKPLPKRIEDLIIYKLHVGALGFGRTSPGTLKDAMDWVDHIAKLNVNAVELLPMCEFGGTSENWGYATSHFFAIEYSEGGRDQYKHFVKACHQRGIAVIMDVVYNHYAHSAERAESCYDSKLPEHNIYYWYEGKSSDYTHPGSNTPFPEGGYADNMSTAWAPRYDSEMVRKMFISSAVSLVREFHIDGLRVDQTTSIHNYNKLHANGHELGRANQFGARLLRELSRTVRMFKPDMLMIAEDHSTWGQVTKPVEQDGMGFDARWYADFCHHLAGDTDKGSDYAKLVYGAAAFGSGVTLRLDYFAGALLGSADQKVVYGESHDEAGNSKGPLYDPDYTDNDKKYTSHRAIVVGVNAAPLVGDTRRYAEARCRYQWGMAVLSAGTPMFLFGEECGACQRFKYNAVLKNREDLPALSAGYGKNLLAFYSGINRLRLGNSGLRSRSIDVVHVHNDNRVIAFRRWDAQQSFLIVASLNDRPFDQGYVLTSPRIEHGRWREIFNSDSIYYGGNNIGNCGASLPTVGDSLTVVIPFASVLVFAHERSE